MFAVPVLIVIFVILFFIFKLRITCTEDGLVIIHFWWKGERKEIII